MTASPSSVPPPNDRPHPPSAAPWPVRARYDSLVRQAAAAVPAGGASIAVVVGRALSGLLLAGAVAVAFGMSAGASIVLLVAFAVLAWLGRGLANVLVAAAVTLAGLSVAFRLVMVVSPGATWSLGWLGPLAVILFVLAMLVARRLGVEEPPRVVAAATLVDLVAAASGLFLAALSVHRTAGHAASAWLLTSEDNGAWMNSVGNLRVSGGVSAVTALPVKTFGPVIGVFLAFARSFEGGLWPGSVSASSTADVVLSAHILLVALSPVVAGLVVRRTLRHGRLLLPLIAWVSICALLVPYCMILAGFGFLSASLSLELLLTAALLVPGTRLDLSRQRSVVAWLSAAGLIYAAGAAWVPLVPIAGVILAGWWLAVAWPAVWRGPMSKVRLAAVLAVLTLGYGVALLEQYRDVVSPIGGGDALLSATGVTPQVSENFLLLGLALLALGWAAYGLPVRGQSRTRPTFLTPLAVLIAYVSVITLVEAVQTHAAPHYGSIKLTFVLVGAVVMLGLADLFASPWLGRLRLEVATFLLVASLGATALQQGPGQIALSQAWPYLAQQPTWINTVQREAASPHRVLCLGLTDKPDESVPSDDAYTCSRWVSSLQGRDDAVALSWRFVQLGRQPVANAVALVRKARDKPWVIVVVGDAAKLRNRKAWWAPIVALPQLTFVPVS